MSKKSKLWNAAAKASKIYPLYTRFVFDGEKMVRVRETTKHGRPNPKWLKAPYELVIWDSTGNHILRESPPTFK